MKKPKPELRTAALHVKVKPSVKSAADEMAADDRRSIADWVSLLIEAEAERRRKGK
jgi:predicted HicB family RNase H-like nuclease